jgi:prolyl-tRNA synthetase
VEAAEVRAGDPCPRCGAALSIDRGIEIGHIFQLGRKFADAFGLDVSGPEGEQIRVTMGSYGVGVSRAVAAIVEQHHDDAGICWPPSVAPFQVHLVPLGKADEPYALAERLANDLEAAGISVLIDDRRVAAGISFNDADLIGAPTIVVLGKALVDGNVEVKDRRTGERSVVPVDDLVARLTS